jgi:hypothetical protein
MSGDPEGKAALFGAPQSLPDVGPGDHGRAASRGEGPVLIACSECDTSTRVSYRDLGGRILRVSLWNPQREHAHWLKCPACGRRNWCRLSL